MFSFICCCCRREAKPLQTGDTSELCSSTCAHVQLNVQTPRGSRSTFIAPAKVSPRQMARRVRGELAGMRQSKKDETQAQQMQHQHRMDDMKAVHDAEMAEMLQSSVDDTAACNATMAAINTDARQHMEQHMADHNTRLAAMRNVNDCVEVKRNERINVRKLANKQKLKNMAQRLDTQCSDLKHKKHNDERLHCQRMKMLSFSCAGKAKDTRNRNAANMEAKRQGNRDAALAQQSKVNSSNERHQQNLNDKKLRHEQEVRDIKVLNNAKSAQHAVKMSRMKGKNKHKEDDANHMLLQFLAVENKLKQSNGRCAVHERALAENAQTIQLSRKRRSLLVTQAEVVQAVQATIQKHHFESANQAASAKRRTFDSEREEVLYTQREIQSVVNANGVFYAEMVTLMKELSMMNVQIRG